MKRREFLLDAVVLGGGLVLTGCAGSPNSPSASMPSASGPATRTFNANLGGNGIYPFRSQVNGWLYQALNAEGIIVDSRQVSGVDSRTGVPFSGNLIIAMTLNGVWVQPPNGFDFNINGVEYYDPMTGGKATIADYYKLPVKIDDYIVITLPPKWDGVSD